MKIIQNRTAKIGTQSGTLVYVGVPGSGRVTIRRMDYSEQDVREREISTLGECVMKDDDRVVWINIDGVHDTNIVEDVCAMYGIHPLIQEDIVNTDQRPKCNILEEYVYIVLRMLEYDDDAKCVLSEQVSLLFGERFVITFLEDPGDVFDGVRERLRTGMGRIRKMGSDYLAYSLVDVIVDGYFSVLEKISETIEDLEEKMLLEPEKADLRELHEMRSSLLYLRKQILPVRELLGALERGDIPFAGEQFRVFMKDVMEHCYHIIDIVETSREMVAGLVDIYLSISSNRMNEVMKVLTMIATAFIPLTFIAGIYGMNFRHMPELEWYWGYPAALAGMCVIGVGLLYYFKKKKWL